MVWVAISFSRGSFWPREQTWVSCITGRFFTIRTTREGLIFFFILKYNHLVLRILFIHFFPLYTHDFRVVGFQFLKPYLEQTSAGKESTCNAGNLGSIPGLGRSPGKEQLSTPIFWLGEFHGLYSPWGRKESDTTEQLSLHKQREMLPLSLLLLHECSDSPKLREP